MSSEWKTVNLLDEYEVRSGLSKPAKDFGSGYPFLSFKDVFYNYFTPTKLGDLVQSTAKERDSCSIKRGDLFLTRTSETMHELGMSCVALQDYPEATFNGFCKRLRPKSSTELVPEYVGYFFRSPSFRQTMLSMSTMSTRASLNNEMIARLQISYPPKAIQIEIAAILKSLDDRIALLRETNATLEAIAQALFKSWFVDFDPVHANAAALENKEQAPSLPPEIQALFPATFTDSPQGPIPEGWYVGAIKLACQKVESGGTPKRSVPEYWSGDIPWLSSGEVRNPIVLDTKETISQLGVKESSAKLWPTGSTIVAMYGATAGEVCILAKSSTANQACCGLIPKSNTRSFVFFCIRRESENLAAKSSGSAQQNLNKGLVESHEVVLPTSQVLTVFEDRIGTLLDGWIENEKKAQTLATLRDTLLPRLISGKLRLPDAQAILEEDIYAAK